jgi:gas vesicle protein
MSQRDNFSGGFLLGAIVGGVVGGALGALFASGRLNELVASEETLLESNQEDAKAGKAKRRSLKSANGQGDIEAARRGLEDKIAQLNDAIDDVRQKLGGVNGMPPKPSERSISREL